MSNDDLYTQCEIEAYEPVEHGLKFFRDVAYISTKFAKNGKTIKINGSELRWKVIRCFSTETLERLNAMRDSWKRFSDVLDAH